MTFTDIIELKKRGNKLNKEQIDFFVRGVTDGSIPDYQTAALLMAIVLNGMDGEETYNLTDAMLHSGRVLSRGGITGVIADKHSTGGVSDSTTLIVVPVVCCLGIKVAKLSGRGLGFSGGTLDKLESFTGFNVALSPLEFENTVNTTGAAISGQTGETVPADKKLYALRDVTATVDSIPLIASSVMSKKLASFADVIVLDVKYGSGSFMKDKNDAVKLAELMVDTGKRAGRKISALVTSMEQPLGDFVGCDLEAVSAIAVLKGEKNPLREVSTALSAKIIALANGISYESAFKMCGEVIDSGKALDKLKEIILAQGGSLGLFEGNYTPKAQSRDVLCQKDGYIIGINTENIGRASVELGCGRKHKDDEIDHAAGIKIFKRLGDCVKKGDALARLYYNNSGADEAERLIVGAYQIGEAKEPLPKLIYAQID